MPKGEKTVLVVEDEKPLLEAVSLKLQNHGFLVVTARTVEQALHYLEEAVKVDAIWLDHYLIGKESGLDLVAQLKERGGAWSRIPTFVVSNTATPDKVRSYLKLGVEKYYVKSNHRLEEIIADIASTLDSGEGE